MVATCLYSYLKKVGGWQTAISQVLKLDEYVHFFKNQWRTMLMKYFHFTASATSKLLYWRSTADNARDPGSDGVTLPVARQTVVKGQWNVLPRYVINYVTKISWSRWYCCVRNLTNLLKFFCDNFFEGRVA